jgi:hypothetical protein
MVKKTYKTYSLRGLDIHIKDKEGNSLVIVFRGGIQIDSTARYTTSDPFIQEALERCTGFGRDYYLEAEKDLTPVEKPAPVKEKKAAPKPEKEIMTEVKGSERFRNLVEMKNRMTELGIEFEEGANYSQAKAAATKAGYDFQIQK